MAICKYDTMFFAYQNAAWALVPSSNLRDEARIWWIRILLFQHRKRREEAKARRVLLIMQIWQTYAGKFSFFGKDRASLNIEEPFSAIKIKYTYRVCYIVRYQAFVFQIVK